jgi:hypothetical protein
MQPKIFVCGKNNLQPQVDKFVNDLKLPRSLLPKTVEVLKLNGFPTKPPESFDHAKVLGLRRVSGGGWTRRETIQKFSGVSFRDLKSWVAKIACSHYPVPNWVRPAARALERLANLESIDLDNLISGNLLEKCNLFFDLISSAGDPTGGVLEIKAVDHPVGKLYTDASGIATGACLVINGNVVEDV